MILRAFAVLSQFAPLLTSNLVKEYLYNLSMSLWTNTRHCYSSPSRLILVIIIVGGHEQIILFQEIRHTLANCSSNEKARNHRCEDSYQSKRYDTRHWTQGSISVVGTITLAHTQYTNCLSRLQTRNPLHQRQNHDEEVITHAVVTRTDTNNTQSFIKMICMRFANFRW